MLGPLGPFTIKLEALLEALSLRPATKPMQVHAVYDSTISSLFFIAIVYYLLKPHSPNLR